MEAVVREGDYRDRRIRREEGWQRSTKTGHLGPPRSPAVLTNCKHSSQALFLLYTPYVKVLLIQTKIVTLNK